MNDVIGATVKGHNKQPGKIEWRVLVVDQVRAVYLVILRTVLYCVPACHEDGVGLHQDARALGGGNHQ